MMEKADILKQVNVIFNEILDDENVALQNETTAEDVEGWDSLTHIQIIVAVEKQFKIRFMSQEIRSWNSVGEMIDSIYSKL